ncbi:MAG: hypothetical protein ABIL49_02825 [candidate division WOR-3 bacterium]|jgi:hypothetical protein
MKKFSELIFSRLSNAFKLVFFLIALINLILIFALSKVFEKSSDIGFIRGQLTSFSLMIYSVISNIHSKEYARVSFSENLKRTMPVLNKYKGESWASKFSKFIEDFNKFIESPDKRKADNMFVFAEDLNRELIEIDSESRRIASIGVIIVIILNVAFVGFVGILMIRYSYNLSLEFSEPLIEIRNILSRIALGSIEKGFEYRGNIEEVYEIYESIETLRKDLHESKLRIQEILRRYREI